MKKYLTFIAIMVATTTFANDKINLSLIKKFLSPSDTITNVKESVIPGLYEVVLNSRVLYVSADGEKVINGEIYDIKNKINYTEDSNKKLRKAAVDKIADNDKIIYKAKDEKYKVSIFTDISCGYCRKLHRQIADYNDKGITIEYLAFPREGKNSNTMKIMQNIWCSENKTTALTEAKINNQPPEKTCKGTQVAEQYLLGNNLGINGTPAIIFENGEMSPGYLSPEDLLQALKISQK